MARNDFKKLNPQFISTDENDDSERFDVDSHSDKVGVESKLKVSITASNSDGSTPLGAVNPEEVTIVEEAAVILGACCLCGEDDQPQCIGDQTLQECDNLNGEWFENQTCDDVNNCQGKDCTDDDDDDDDDDDTSLEDDIILPEDETEPDSAFTLDPPFNGLDRMIVDARFALGLESAILVLSGTGTPGEIIQLEDNTNPGTWRNVAVVDGDGFWKTNDTDGPGSAFYEAATVSLDRDYNLSGEWYKVRVRYESDRTGLVKSENTFLPGFVFMSISQSERAQMFSWGKDNWPVDSFPITNNHNFQLLQHEGSNTSWFAGLVNPVPDGGGITGEMLFDENGDFIPAVRGIDDGNLYFAKLPQRYRISSDDPDGLILRTSRESSTKFTTTLKHMANMFNETMPNIPVLFVDNQWSGSSRNNLFESQTFWNGNRVTRDFGFTKTCVDWCRSHGTEIGVVDDMWYASDSAKFRFDCAFSPLYSNVKIDFPGAQPGAGNFEDFPDGIEVVGVTSDYTHGAFYPPGANNNNQEDFVCWASFFDASSNNPEAHELGVGIFRKDRTRWAFMSTNRFSTVQSQIKERKVLNGQGNPTGAIWGLWGSGASNTEVINAKSPQQTMKNADQQYDIIGGGAEELDPDESTWFNGEPNRVLTSDNASIDFNTLTGRSRGQNLPRLRRGVFNLANQEHNYFMRTSFDPTVVCHGEMAVDGDNDGLADTWSDDPHPCGNIAERLGNLADERDNDFGRAMDGQMKMAEYTVLSAARTAGEVNIPIPVFELDTISSTEAVFRVEDFNGNDLPTGSSVETLFTVRGEPDLADPAFDLRDTLEHPNYKKIIGFERGRIIDDIENPPTNTNMPFLDPNSFSYEGFQTEFGADGLSVRVIPDEDKPFQNGDVIRFNGGGCDSTHLWQSDCMHRIYRGMAILSIPGISAEGIPISAEPRTPIVTVSGL